MDDQNVTYTQSGILFSLKEEGAPEAQCSVDEPWQHHAK